MLSASLRIALATMIVLTIFGIAAPLADARPMEIFADGLAYPEGPVLAPDGGFYVADMELGQILLVNDDSVSVVATIASCGPTAIAIQADHLLVNCHRARKLLALPQPTDNAEPRLFAEINRPNDMTAAGDGAVYVSSSGEFDPDLTGQGSIVHVMPDGTTRVVADGFHYANGVALSPDGGHLYVSEHFAGHVWRFRVGADGSLAERTLFATLPKPDDAPWLTGPDGIEFLGPDTLAPDALAIAQYGLGRVFVFDLTGDVLAVHETPGFPQVTNLVMDPSSQTLYATASRAAAPDSDFAHEGAIFAIKDPLTP